jgi:predicted MFS family arabinose efflux permease
MPARLASVLVVPGVRRLIVSALLGRLPQGMSGLSILLLVRDRTGSYALAGVAVGAFALATAAAAPAQGALLDRLGRTRVLPPCALAQALVLVALVVAARERTGGVVLIALAGLAGALLPPIGPSVRALWREVIADPAVLEAAFALDAITQEAIWITGPLVVAIVIGISSPATAILALGSFGVTGTLLFVASPLVYGRPTPEPGRRGSALASPGLRALLAPVALTGFGLGAVEVGLPALALHAGSRQASGVLLSLWSVGSMVGGVWYGSRDWHSPLSARYRRLLLAAVACTAPLIAARSLMAGLVLCVLAGMSIAPVFSCQYLLVGRVARAGTENEAFTWVSAALVGGIALGSAAGGAVVASAGVGAPFALSCAAAALSAALALLGRRQIEARA